MELDIILTADYANLAQGDKPNAMGIFTNIYVSAVPARHPEMYLILKFSVTAMEYDTTRKLTVRLLNEDATEEVWACLPS